MSSPETSHHEVICSGTNHTHHHAELLERPATASTSGNATSPARASWSTPGSEQSAAVSAASHKHRLTLASECPGREWLIADGRQSSPGLGDRIPPFDAADRSGRCHRHGGRRPLLREGGRPQLLPASMHTPLAAFPRTFALALYTDRLRGPPVLQATRHGSRPPPGCQPSSATAMDELPDPDDIRHFSPHGQAEEWSGWRKLSRTRLVTELRLAGATQHRSKPTACWSSSCSPIADRAFPCPTAIPSSLRFRPLDPELCLEQILCFKHHRKVARDNDGEDLQLHTLQLLPERERSQLCNGAAVEVLQGLAPVQAIPVRHEDASSTSQEAPPRPVFLRNGHWKLRRCSCPILQRQRIWANYWISTLELRWTQGQR